MANVFGTDHFKVRRAFLHDFHHPWNLQKKIRSDDCACEGAEGEVQAS